MNARMKKRLMAVSGVIIIVLIVILAVVGGSTAAQTVTVAEAVENPTVGQKIQVSGNVVSNSFAVEEGVLTFKIYDPDGSAATQLEVSYEGSASSTFGNEVTAICTGKINDEGVLLCSELVTKCPSKYESAEAALSVSRLLDYGDEILDKTVKVAGVVKDNTLKAAGQDERFVLLDASGEEGGEVSVLFDGALSEDVADGSSVVLTGSMNADACFVATNVALES